MKTKNKTKLVMTLMGLLFLVFIFSLGYNIKKCEIPEFTHEAQSAYPNNNPGGSLFPGYFDFDGVIYKNLGKYMLYQNIDKNIGGVNKEGPFWTNASAFKIKNVDIARAIAVQAGDGSYYLAYNYKYWEKRLPEFIIIALLILGTAGITIMIYKGIILNKNKMRE